MTTTSTLPSIGPAPPNLARTSVPEALQPRIVREAEKMGEPTKKPAPKPKIAKPKPPPPPEVPHSGGKQNSSINLGGASAVAVQVEHARSRVAAEVVPESAPETVAEIVEAATPETLETQKSGPKLASQLSETEKSDLARLKARDQEVRAHEAAHASTGGGFTGSPQYEFVRGPDGQQYAVGGHVDIDVSPVADNPEATIQKMEVIKSAALAPARPSGADRAVAAAATAAQAQAAADLRELKKEEKEEALKSDKGDSSNEPTPSQDISGLTLGQVTEPVAINLIA